MIATSTPFNLSSLKVGDEVGITWRSLGGQCEHVSNVTELEDDGCICVKGYDLPFWPDDGREMETVWGGVVTLSPNGTRLCAPSDEGRRASAREDIYRLLDDLVEIRSDLSLDDLQRLDGRLKALLADFGPRPVIDVASGLKLVQGGDK
jgi:hypothetical protein